MQSAGEGKSGCKGKQPGPAQDAQQGARTGTICVKRAVKNEVRNWSWQPASRVVSSCTYLFIYLTLAISSAYVR